MFVHEYTCIGPANCTERGHKLKRNKWQMFEWVEQKTKPKHIHKYSILIRCQTHKNNNSPTTRAIKNKTNALTWLSVAIIDVYWQTVHGNKKVNKDNYQLLAIFSSFCVQQIFSFCFRASLAQISNPLAGSYQSSKQHRTPTL